MKILKLAKESGMETSPTTTETGMSVFKEMMLPFETEVSDQQRVMTADHVTKGVEVGVEVGIAIVIDQVGTNIKTTTGDDRDQGPKKGHADDAQGPGIGHSVVEIESMHNTEGIVVVHPTTMVATDQEMNITSADDEGHIRIKCKA